jgi:ribonuclease E
MSDPVPQLPNEPTSPQGSPPAEGDATRKPRRRGSRGGRNRNRSRTGQAATPAEPTAGPRKPQIGDTLPAPTPTPAPAPKAANDRANDGAADGAADDPAKRRRRRGGRGRSRGSRPVESVVGEAVELDPETLERRRGRERKGRPVGRYLMCVHAQAGVTQIAVLEGRALIEHYVSRHQDDATQIHGNIYLGRVQNVLPGMEAAFVDIGTPKNAVLYRGDLQFDADDVDGGGGGGGQARIEQILKARQSIVSQVTKNPIGAKGARLTQEVSLPGRFVVLIPNSSTYGISKRLSDDERKRLRSILDKIKPAEHGLIVRTAADGATREELERDVARLLGQWERIDALAKRSSAPQLLYREPDVAVRVIREEFNSSYRGVVIDDRELYEEVRDYVASITPELADRVEYHDPEVEPLPLFETYHVHEQVHKALDRKVWLPSGGSLIIERTEALTVIDVNTGKNVGSSSLEETVFRNNLEAAEEVARQLRLRDIGGIIVIDFIDMEIRKNRDEVIRVFREALARDKTRTQVFDISELGLVEMTRKRIGEGLIESMSSTCPVCEGRGMVFDKDLLGS